MGTGLLLSILPLSLVRDAQVLWNLLRDPNPGPQLLKLDSSKGFGEEVSELVLRADVVGLDAPIVQAAPYEVILHPDVLDVLMEDRFLR
jgi:hypothetical protein